MLTACLLLISCNVAVDKPTGQTQQSKEPTKLIETFTPADPFASDTPDPCTGWDCKISGVIYTGSADPGNEFVGVPVKLSQHSWCSPTAGEQEAQSGTNGSFTFEVFIHDTDTFHVQVEMEGYEPAKVILGGFDCLYCGCPLVGIVLNAAN